MSGQSPSGSVGFGRTRDQVLVSIRRIIRAIDMHSKTLIQEHGLTVPQLVVLRELDHDQPVSVGELARRVDLSQGTVTGILDRLARRGLVTRQRSETDKRRILIRRTPEANVLLDSAPPLLQDQFTRAFDELKDWEKSLILSSLQRVVAMMEAQTIDSASMLTTGPIHSPDTTNRLNH